ncbi:opioid growth factor receptor-like protein 1, partial [Octodon degus]|uniref:Opioid growth factor receptor-like protein 1 n=1 Tax=Octodon degus TaxID=10160 RepID=A0A6P3VB55_OCTDE
MPILNALTGSNNFIPKSIIAFYLAYNCCHLRSLKFILWAAGRCLSMGNLLGGVGLREPPEEPEAEAGDAQAAGAGQGGECAEAAAKPKRSFYAARDSYKYRHQYPQNFKDIRYQNDFSKLRFYKNKIPFKPDGIYIEEVLNKWKGDYEKLENNHTYIQWLFPLREQGLNFYAKELTTYEIEEFKKTKEAIRRFLLAYKMMLEFFGIKLIDKT